MESQTFPLPGLWPGAFVETLGQLLDNSPALVRARGAHGKTAPRLAEGEAIALPFEAEPFLATTQPLSATSPYAKLEPKMIVANGRGMCYHFGVAALPWPGLCGRLSAWTASQAAPGGFVQ